MPNILEDNDFTVAAVNGPARFSAPFPHINADYVLEQDYLQNFDNYAPLALNTTAVAYPTYYLVGESPLQDAGGGVAKWTRTYAQIPAAFSEIGGNVSYNFIGFWGVFGINVKVISGRQRFTRTVPVRVQRDFFLVGLAGAYPTSETIPTLSDQIYYQTVPTVTVDYLADSPPFTLATTPSRTTYEGLVNAGGEIIIESSNITRWKGNIWMRETRYIKAL